MIDKFATLVLSLFTLNAFEAVASETAPERDAPSFRASAIPVLPRKLTGENALVRVAGHEFHWWRDQNGLINFRRCTLNDGHLACEAPMLFNGLDEKQLPRFMAYYSERLEHWGSGHLSSLASVVTGSLGTATAYIGGFAALKIFKDALPQSMNHVLDSMVFKSGFHLVSIGTLGVLVYFTTDNLRHLYRQKKLRRELLGVEGKDFWNLPVALNSDDLFEEFVATFRRALYEYTHGGPPFDQTDNLIFQ